MAQPSEEQILEGLLKAAGDDALGMLLITVSRHDDEQVKVMTRGVKRHDQPETENTLREIMEKIVAIFDECGTDITDTFVRRN